MTPMLFRWVYVNGQKFSDFIRANVINHSLISLLQIRFIYREIFSYDGEEKGNSVSCFFRSSANPVPGLDRDTYLSPGTVYGEKKFGFWYGVLSYIGSYYARISYHFCVPNKISNA